MVDRISADDILKKMITGFLMQTDNDKTIINLLSDSVTSYSHLATVIGKHYSNGVVLKYPDYCVKCGKPMVIHSLCAYCFVQSSTTKRRKIFFGPEYLNKLNSFPCKLYISKDTIEFLQNGDVTIKIIEIPNLKKKDSVTNISISINSNSISLEENQADISKLLNSYCSIIDVHEAITINEIKILRCEHHSLIYGELFIKLQKPTQIFTVSQYYKLANLLFYHKECQDLVVSFQNTNGDALIRMPIRGANCQHLSVFEYDQLIDRCPICNTEIGEAYLDEFASIILKSIGDKMLAHHNFSVQMFKNYSFISNDIKYSIQNGKAVQKIEQNIPPKVSQITYPLDFLPKNTFQKYSKPIIIQNVDCTNPKANENTNTNEEIKQMTKYSAKKINFLKEIPTNLLKVNCFPGFTSFSDFKNKVVKCPTTINADKIAKLRMTNGIQNITNGKPPKTQMPESFIMQSTVLAIPANVTPLDTNNKSEGIAICPLCNEREINYLIVGPKDR